MSGLEDADWDLLEATQESLREHMAIIKQLRAENERYREVLEDMANYHRAGLTGDDAHQMIDDAQQALKEQE